MVEALLVGAVMVTLISTGRVIKEKVFGNPNDAAIRKAVQDQHTVMIDRLREEGNNSLADKYAKIVKKLHDNEEYPYVDEVLAMLEKDSR